MRSEGGENPSGRERHNKMLNRNKFHGDASDEIARTWRKRLPLAKFVAGKIPETVVGGVLVGFTERRIIENLLDEFVDGEALVQNHHSDVDELRGVFPDDADTEKFPVTGSKDELQHAGRVADDVAPCIVFVKSAARAELHLLFRAGLFGLSGGGNLGNRVNAHGQKRCDTLLVLEAEGMANGDAALFDRSGRERGKSDDITRGVNSGNRCAVVGVHRNVAAVVEGEPGFFECESVHGGAPARGKKGGLRLEQFPAFHFQANARRGILNFGGAFVEQEVHAETCQAVMKSVGDFNVKKGKQAVAAINESDLDAKRHENRRVLATDDAAADHRKALGDALHLKKGVGVESVNVIKCDFGRTVRLGAGGDQNNFAMQPAHAVCSGYSHGVRILEGSLAVKQLNPVELEIFLDAAPLHLHDFAFMVHEIVDRQILF